MNRTVERTFSILQLIAERTSGITLQELSDEMGIAKSSAYVILQTLVQLGYVTTMRNNDKKYCLGIETFSLGAKYVNDMSLVQQCAVYLPAIAEKYNKTAFVAVLDGTSVVYIYKYVAQNARLTSCPLGSKKDAYATALGKAILAFLPPDKMSTVIDKIEFKSFTDYTLTSRDAFLNDLKNTRKRGYSLDIRELEDITSCCGAPIFDYSGNVIAAASLSDMYSEHMDDELIAKELRDTTLQISQNLGYLCQ